MNAPDEIERRYPLLGELMAYLGQDLYEEYDNWGRAIADFSAYHASDSKNAIEEVERVFRDFPDEAQLRSFLVRQGLCVVEVAEGSLSARALLDAVIRALRRSGEGRDP